MGKKRCHAEPNTQLNHKKRRVLPKQQHIGYTQDRRDPQSTPQQQTQPLVTHWRCVVHSSQGHIKGRCTAKERQEAACPIKRHLLTLKKQN